MHGASRQRQTRRFPSVRSPRAEKKISIFREYLRAREGEEERRRKCFLQSGFCGKPWPKRGRNYSYKPVISNKFDYEISVSKCLNIQDVQTVVSFIVLLVYGSIWMHSKLAYNAELA